MKTFKKFLAEDFNSKTRETLSTVTNLLHFYKNKFADKKMSEEDVKQIAVKLEKLLNDQLQKDGKEPITLDLVAADDVNDQAYFRNKNRTMTVPIPRKANDIRVDGIMSSLSHELQHSFQPFGLSKITNFKSARGKNFGLAFVKIMLHPLESENYITSFCYGINRLVTPKQLDQFLQMSTVPWYKSHPEDRQQKSNPKELPSIYLTWDSLVPDICSDIGIPHSIASDVTVKNILCRIYDATQTVWLINDSGLKSKLANFLTKFRKTYDSYYRG